MTRCVSTCKQFPEKDCNPPRCKYNNGEQRKFCRLSHKYKMVPPKEESLFTSKKRKGVCRVTRKYKKGELRPAAEKKIQEFIGKSQKFLEVICSNSGECLAFGRRTAEITAFFKGFTDFSYAVSCKGIGAPSVNGFIKGIEFKKNNYTSHAVLKSSRKPGADNLVYEYVVGEKFINRVSQRFPCFVQTYGFYYYPYVKIWNEFINNKDITDLNILKDLRLQNKLDYFKACTFSKFACILVQNLPQAISIGDVHQDPSKEDSVNKDLLYILFIVYHALYSLRKQFTHYDLHWENVLLYQVPIDPKTKEMKYVQYQYHFKDETITFYCPFIPKIIDYGRSFFDNGNTNSKKIYKKICEVCKDCGEDKGFGYLYPKDEYFITSSKKNESHDLRLLYIIMRDTHNISTVTTHAYIHLKQLLKKVTYGVGITTNKQYGTEENLTLHPTGDNITNVTDAYEELKKLVLHPDIAKENAQAYLVNQYGILHVYDDGRPMVFEPTKE